MDIRNCKHVRVRGSNDFKMDIETFLKSLEKQFNLDIRTLPQWKDLIQNMHVVLSDYNTKVQNAAFRKANIINKLYIQNTRPSPFELTNNLVRTAKLWQDMESKRKKREAISETSSDISYPHKNPSIELVGEVSDYKSTVTHPNTEMIQSDSLIKKLDAVVLDNDEQQSIEPQLPVYICTNQHKILSPLGSHISQLSCKLKDNRSESQKEDLEYLTFNSTNSVSCQPEKITITDKMVGYNVVKLFLTNKTTEYLHVQFKNILDSNNFSSFDVKPKNATKLYPGLTACFKLNFKLVKSLDNFSTFLYFRVRRKVITETPEEFLYIPIVTDFIEDRCVLVPSSISIPAVYSWQLSIKQGFPKTLLQITVKDNFRYNLHVRKRDITIDQVAADATTSVEAIVPSTESTEQHANEEGLNTFTPPSVKESEEDMFTSEVVTKVLDDIVDLSLQPFVFKQTFLRLSPRTQRMTLVYFTKAEHIGFHQCLYDLNFYDTETEILVFTKTIRVYAEVLPNPIVINPNMLDMSNSEVVHGQCCGKFVITNYNKVYTFDVKIKTTTRMDKIFSISPKESSIVAQSSTSFFVNYCSKSLNTRCTTDDNAYFVIKIVLKSSIPMFSNIPPIFYEIIAPCIAEFKKVYNVEINEEIAE